jgi:hypothetical protein
LAGTLSAEPCWWKVDLAWRWSAGSQRESAALERWLKDPDGQRRWIREGRRWPRSQWEIDRSPWQRALAALEH